MNILPTTFYVNSSHLPSITRAALGIYDMPDRQYYHPNIEAFRSATISESTWLRYFLIIRDFLKNWGAVKTTIRAYFEYEDTRTDLHPHVVKLYIKKFDDLESLDLANNEASIKDVMDGLLGIRGMKSGGTIVTKIMHLFHPTTFVALDSTIREKLTIPNDNSPKEVIESSYLKYMALVKDFINDEKFTRDIADLSKKYRVSKTYVVDKFFWSIASGHLYHCKICGFLIFDRYFMEGKGGPKKIQGSKQNHAHSTLCLIGDYDVEYHNDTHKVEIVKFEPQFIDNLVDKYFT